MTDDERLLELLARALAPGTVEPPPERVKALRLRATAQQEGSAPSLSAASESERREPELEPSAPVPLHRPAPRSPALPGGWSRRAGWLAAAAAVAAAALVVAGLALPWLLDRGNGSPQVASGSASSARGAVARLRIALQSHDPVEVARADAELLEQTRHLPEGQRRLLEHEAVQAHTEAVQFLREHPTPEALSAVPSGPTGAPPAGQAPAPGSPPGAPGTTLAPTPPAAPTTVAPTTLPPSPVGSPTVRITGVHATLDGPFAVDFTVEGFTPDASGKPGTYAIRFSFDRGEDPVVWDGPSPWTFPVADAIRHHRVCADVVDAAGAEQPHSGDCANIP
jgi:hypothetical protein